MPWTSWSLNPPRKVRYKHSSLNQHLYRKRFRLNPEPKLPLASRLCERRLREEHDVGVCLVALLSPAQSTSLSGVTVKHFCQAYRARERECYEVQRMPSVATPTHSITTAEVFLSSKSCFRQKLLAGCTHKVRGSRTGCPRSALSSASCKCTYDPLMHPCVSGKGIHCRRGALNIFAVGTHKPS